MSLTFIPRAYINGSGVALGRILAPDGSAAAPSYGFASEPTMGLYRVGTNAMGVVISGSAKTIWYPGVIANSVSTLTGSATTSAFTLTQTLSTTGVVDGVFRMAVTNTASGAGSYIAAFYGGAAGATKLFSVDMSGNAVLSGAVTATSFYGGSANGYYWAGRSQFKSSANGAIEALANDGLSFSVFNYGPTTGNTRGSSAWNNGLTTIDMATATGTGTGTITSPTTAIPANSYVVGMTCKVTTILAGAALTTISIGDGTDPDKWGSGIAIAAGTTVNFGNHTAAPSYYGSATSIVITADAGVLSTGVLSCSPIIISATPIGS